MAVKDLLRPKAKAEIIRSLRQLSLDPELLGMMEEDHEVYSVVTGILSLSGLTPQERVFLVNRFAEIMRRER
ncbi:MAG TPA: hypothetical protein VK155_15000 [Bacteroidales bacterium]|nr:hypothetical protein [Bacteroidales bacterium]